MAAAAIIGALGSVAGAASTARQGIASTLINQTLPLTKQQQQQNEWNAQQAQLQRDWQENMYQKYSSIDAQVKQLQAAGINPAAMYGSIGNGSIGAGSAASAGISNQNSFSARSNVVQDAIQAIGAQQMLKNNEVERELKRSQIAVNEAQASSIDNNNSVFSERWSLEQALGTAKIDNVTANTLVQRSQSALNDAHISQSVAQTALINANTALANIDAEFRERYLEVNIALTAANARYRDIEANYLGAEKAIDLGIKRNEFRMSRQFYENQVKIQDQQLLNMKSEGQLTDEQYRNLTARTTREVIGIVSDYGKYSTLLARASGSYNTEVGEFFNALFEKYGVPSGEKFRYKNDPKERASRAFWDMVNPVKRGARTMLEILKYKRK